MGFEENQNTKENKLSRFVKQNPSEEGVLGLSVCIFFKVRKLITEIFLKFSTTILNDIVSSKSVGRLQGLKCAFAKPPTGTQIEKCMRIKEDISKQSLEHSSILLASEICSLLNISKEVQSQYKSLATENSSHLTKHKNIRWHFLCAKALCWILGATVKRTKQRTTCLCRATDSPRLFS